MAIEGLEPPRFSARLFESRMSAISSYGQFKMVVIAGLEPALGTNLVLHVYKACDATLHYMTLFIRTLKVVALPGLEPRSRSNLELAVYKAAALPLCYSAIIKLERHVGNDPTYSPWKGDTQPLCQ